MPYIRIFALLLLLTPNLQAQNTPFQLQLEPLQIPQLGGLQSFAFGTSNGKWLLIGGRLDGLHRRQPFATFDIAGHNNQIIVADPQNSQKWSAPLNSLPAALREQLSSTNMEFFQKGDYLYIIGGYGYSATLGDHTTYPYLTVVSENLPRFANEVIKLDELPSDTVVLGYIYGGIASTQPNIFWINTGTESQASSTIFKVTLLKNTVVGTDLLNPQSSGSLKLQLYPNPSGGQVSLKFFLQHSGDVRLHISDFSGKLLHQELLKNLPAGEHILRRNLPAPQGQAFLVRLESATEQALVKGMALER